MAEGDEIPAEHAVFLTTVRPGDSIRLPSEQEDLKAVFSTIGPVESVSSQFDAQLERTGVSLVFRHKRDAELAVTHLSGKVRLHGFRILVLSDNIKQPEEAQQLFRLGDDAPDDEEEEEARRKREREAAAAAAEEGLKELPRNHKLPSDIQLPVVLVPFLPKLSDSAVYARLLDAQQEAEAIKAKVDAQDRRLEDIVTTGNKRPSAQAKKRVRLRANFWNQEVGEQRVSATVAISRIPITRLPNVLPLVLGKAKDGLRAFDVLPADTVGSQCTLIVEFATVEGYARFVSGGAPSKEKGSKQTTIPLGSDFYEVMPASLLIPLEGLLPLQPALAGAEYAFGSMDFDSIGTEFEKAFQ